MNRCVLQRPHITPDPLPIIRPEDVVLKACDFFGTENPMALGWGINKVQKFNSRDNKSVYTHSGIIMNSQGDTIESLWTVDSQNIWKGYAGKRVIIARWEFLEDEQWEKAYLMIMDKHWKKKYPWWRVPLQIIPPLAKYLSFTGMPVCSELVAKVEHWIGARHRWWTGTTPDILADEWRLWKGYSVMIEGIIETTG